MDRHLFPFLPLGSILNQNLFQLFQVEISSLEKIFFLLFDELSDSLLLKKDKIFSFFKPFCRKKLHNLIGIAKCHNSFLVVSYL